METTCGSRSWGPPMPGGSRTSREMSSPYVSAGGHCRTSEQGGAMEQGMTADQLVKALWRRKSLVAAVALSAFIVGTVVVAAMPTQYRSTVVVHVEQQRPPVE